MADTGIQSLIPGIMPIRFNSADNASQIQSGGSESFGDVMDKTSKQTFDVKPKKVQAARTEAKDSGVHDRLTGNKSTVKKLKEAFGDKASEENAAAAAAEIVSDYKNVIAEELGITTEELDSFMQDMNIDDSGLFDVNTLGRLTLMANGMSDMQELLLDNGAMQEFKALLAAMETAETELEGIGVQVSDDGFTELLTGGDITEDVHSAAADMELKESEEPVLEAEKPDEAEKSDSAAEDDNISADVKNNASEASGDEQEDGFAQSKQNDSRLRSAEHENDVRVNGGASEFRLNMTENLEQTLTERVGRVQADSILEQITGQIRANVTGEFKSMEMQLYPEHLGKVGVQVAVRDGVVTAQISAETEAVKKVIEAQLISLKESFSNQGLKVENVEVTVASHSYQQDGMNDDRSGSDKGNGRKARKLNASLLAEINGTADEQTDAEQSQLMEVLGNTVSYSA